MMYAQDNRINMRLLVVYNIFILCRSKVDGGINITVTYRSSSRPINYRVHYNIFQLFGASVTGSPGGPSGSLRPLELYILVYNTCVCILFLFLCYFFHFNRISVRKPMIYHEAPVYIVSPQHYLHGRIRLVCFDSSASGRTIYHKSIDSKEKKTK